MFGMMKPKGKFGSMLPGAMESPYGTPPIAAPVQMAQEGAAAPSPEPRKPGFFKPGGAGQYVFGALADTLARQMDEQPTAIAGIMEQQQRQQLLAERQRMAAAERENGWQDWLRKKEWEQANPGPVNNDTINDVRWYMGASDAEKAAYDAMHPVYKIGPDGMPYPMARTRPVPAPAGVTFTPLDDGGPQAPPAATFPHR